MHKKIRVNLSLLPGFRVLVTYGLLFIIPIICSQCKSYTITEDPLERRLDKLLQIMSMQEKIEQLYYKTDGNDRLGIPQFTGSDGPHGIGNGAKGFTCFPVPIAMAATWDPNLILRVGRSISLEQASRERDRIAGPTLDLLIDPRMGRSAETIGEDPFLGGRIMEAFVMGQNTTSVFGSVKHYNLNTYERNRRTNDYLSDQRSLVEFWGYHWKRTIQHGGAMSVMCAYNWVNGEKCAENKYLIKHLLRDQWGFNYYTMSDWGGFSETGKALEAELDFCEGNDLYIKELPKGVQSGIYDSTLVDRAVRNVLRTKIMSGMMDGVPIIPKDVADGTENRKLAYESGLKSLVLLKNQDAILPLNGKTLKSIAVLGPNAANLPLDGNSSSKVVPPYTITVEESFKNRLGADKVSYSKGCNINDKDDSNFAEAIKIAKQAEYVIFVGGLDQTVEGEGYFLDKEADEKGGGKVSKPDRVSGTVLLPGLQNALIQEIAKVNPNIILVIFSGGICSVTPIEDKVKGILYGFYAGQEGGKAVTDVLFGDYNPSGKLPATMPKNDDQIMPIGPDFTDMVSKGTGYRWFDSQNLTPQYAFGYGLSYTQFEYTNIRANNENIKIGEPVNISFDLKNIGDKKGEEVAQLYLSSNPSTSKFPMPKKQLRDFEKIALKPGETKTITFQLESEDFYIYDETIASYHIPTGQYTVSIGGSSDNLKLQKDLLLIPQPSKPDLSIVNIKTIPAFPKVGDEVVFTASVINNGTKGTQLGEELLVKFFIDGQEVSYYLSNNISIPIGGMKMICAQGLNSKNWIAKDGSFKITALIERSAQLDLNNDNHSTIGILKIPNGKVISRPIYNMLNLNESQR